MRRDKNRQSLGEAMKAMISSLGMEDKIKSMQAAEIFADMMGSYIMKYVENASVKNQILYVKLNSAELRHELLYGKSKIITHINSEMDDDFLKDVKFI